MQYEYQNVRCRKCGKILSLHKPFNPWDDMKGWLVDGHKCEEGIEENEWCMCDLISVSFEPLKSAAEVVEVDEKSNKKVIQ